MTPQDGLPNLRCLGAPELARRERVGILEPTPSPYALRDGSGRLDPRPDRYAGPEDYGDIGEDQAGVWIRRHPEAMLIEEPELWPGWERYCLGHFELRPEDADLLDAFEHQVLMVLIGAHNRAELARMKERTSKRGAS